MSRTVNSHVAKSNLDLSYRHPQYAFVTNEAKTLLAGSKNFQLDDIEVFQRE